MEKYAYINKYLKILNSLIRKKKEPLSQQVIDYYSTVLYKEQLEKYYEDVTFGINCAIENPGYVKIGRKSIILHHTDIHAVPHYDSGYNPLIEIGDNAQIGSYNSIASIKKILIGKNVLFGPHVHITDHSHGYQDITKPIMHQRAFSKGPIIIEDDCWLGFGCHIMPGVHIGKHVAIGANSVVTRDIPPYSVAAGIPAKVVKRFNFETKEWESAK